VGGERVVDRMCRQVGLGVGLQGRVRVAAIGQGAGYGNLRLLVGVLIEARARRKDLDCGKPDVIRDRLR
jgi:hypothetical protein